MRVFWLVLCELGYSNNPALIDRIVKGLIVHHTWHFVPVPTNFGSVVLDPQNGVCFKSKQTILETVSNQRILNGWLTVNYSPSLDCYFDTLSGACMSSSVSTGIPDCDYLNLLILPPGSFLNEAKLISMTDPADLSVIEHEFLDLDPESTPCVLESNITSLGKAIVIESLLALQNVSWSRCNLSSGSVTPFSDLSTLELGTFGSLDCWSNAITSTINFLDSNIGVLLKTPMSPDVCFFETELLELEDFSQGLLVFNRTVTFPEISSPVPFALSPVDPATCSPLRGNPVSCSELDTWSCDAVEGCYIDWNEYVCADTLPGFYSTSMRSVSPCNPILENQRYTAFAWTSPDCPFKCISSSDYVVHGQCVPIPSKGWYVGTCDSDNALHACSDNLEIIEFPDLGSCQNAYYRHVLISPPIPIICVWIKTEAVPVTLFGGIDRWSLGITEQFKFVLTNTTCRNTIFSDSIFTSSGEGWVFIIFDGHNMYVNGKSVNFSDYIDLQIDNSDMFYGPFQPSQKFEILGPFQLRLNEMTEDIATEIFNSIEAPSGFTRTSTSEQELFIIPTSTTTTSEEPNETSTTTNLPESTLGTYTTTEFLTDETQTTSEATAYTYPDSSTAVTAEHTGGSWSEKEMSTTTPGTEQAQSTTTEMYPSSSVTDNEGFSTQPITSSTSTAPAEPSTTSADSTSTEAAAEIATMSTSQLPPEDMTTNPDFTTTDAGGELSSTDSLTISTSQSPTDESTTSADLTTTSREEETFTSESSTTTANDESTTTTVHHTTEENGDMLTTETPSTSISTSATPDYSVTTETPSTTQAEETLTSTESALDSTTNYVTVEEATSTTSPTTLTNGATVIPEPTNPPTDQSTTTTYSPDSTTTQSREELVFTTESTIETNTAYNFDELTTTAPDFVTATAYTEVTSIPVSTEMGVESTITPESTTTTTAFTTTTAQENIPLTETGTTTESFTEMETTYVSTSTGSIAAESSTTSLLPETESTTMTTTFTTFVMQESIPSTETELTTTGPGTQAELTTTTPATRTELITTSPSKEPPATEAKSTSTTTEFLTTETEEHQTTTTELLTTGFEEYHSSVDTTYVSTSAFGPVDEELEATTEGPTSSNIPFTTDHFGSSENTAIPQLTNRPNEYANNSTNDSQLETTTDIPLFSSEAHSSEYPSESSQPATTTEETHATTFETSTSPSVSSDPSSTQTPEDFMPTTTPPGTTFLLGQTTTESFPETYPQIIQSSPSGHELQFGDPLVASSYSSEPSWLPISCITASIAVVIAVASTYVSAMSRRRMTHQIQQVINAEP